MSNSHRTVLVVADPERTECDYEGWLQQQTPVSWDVFTQGYDTAWSGFARSHTIDGILLELPTDQPQTSDKIQRLRHLQARWHGETPPIVVLGNGEVQTAVAILKAGAADYLVRDQITPEILGHALHTAIAQSELQQALQSCEEQFQTSIETMQDCFGIFSALRDDTGQIVDFRIDYLNQAACVNNRLPRSAQLGQRLCEVLPNHRESGLFDEYCRLVETGTPLTKDALIYEDTYGGQQHLARAYDIRAAKHQDGFVASWRDVTDRRQLELDLKQTVESLQQEQTRLRHLIDYAPIGIGIGAASGQVKVINDEMLRLHGYTRQAFEQQGMNWRDFAIAGATDRTAEAMAELRTTGSLPPAEKILQHPDGTQVAVWISATQWLEHEDDHVAFAVDLTRQKQIEAELRASQQRYRELAEAMPQMVWTADANGHVNYWNSRWYEYTGLTATDSTALRGIESVHPDDRDRTLTQWQQAIVTGSRFEVEYRIRDREGRYRWFICRALPTQTEQGPITGWIGTITDIDDRQQLERQLREEITEHRRAERALRDAHQTVNTILDSITDAFIALDDQWRYTYANAQAIQLLRKPPEEMLGRHIWEEVFPDRVGTRSYHELHRAMAERVTVVYEDYNPALDIWFEARVYPSERGLAMYFHDISDRKRAEHEQQQQQATIRRQLAEIEAIYQTAPIGLGILDRELRFVRLNQQLAATNGLPITAHLGRTVPELLPGIAESAVPLLNRVLETGEPLLNVEIVGETAAQPGVQRTWMENWFPLKDAAGTVTGISIVAQEITERKEAEQQLRESQHFIQRVAETTPGILYVYDLDAQRNVYVNRQVTELLGYPPEQVQIMGSDLLPTLIHPSDFEQVMHHLDCIRTAQAGQIIELEYRMGHADGNWRWFHTREVVFSHAADGTVRQVLGISQDVTDRRQAKAALAANEARLQGFVDANVVGILYGDIHGNIFRANDELLRIVGYSRADLEAGHLDWRAMTPPEHLPLDAQAIAEAQATGACTPYEKDYIRKDGSRVSVLIGYSLVGEAREESVVFILDVSDRKQDEAERKRAEKALRRSEDRQRLAIDAAQLGTWDWHLVRNTMTWDARCKDLFGLPADADVTLDTFFLALHPDDHPLFEQLIHTVLNATSEDTYAAEFQVTGIRDGVERWLSAKGRVYFGADDTPRRFIGTVLDITERKQAERALRESEERYRRLFESMEDGFCVIEMLFDDSDRPIDYRFLEVNPAFEQHTGLTQAEGHTARELLPDLEAHWFAIYGRVALTGEATRFEHGSEVMGRWFDVYAFRIEQPENRKVALLFKDITERKAIDLQREQLLQREQVAREEAERANRIKDEFLAILSHELRSPLNPILGWSKLLQTRTLSQEKTAQALSTIERNAKLQTQLIDDLLDIAKILRGKLRLDCSAVDVAFAVEAAIDTVRTAAATKTIALHPTFLDRVKVWGDAGRLQQIVWNLLSNAIKFTPSGGQVTLYLQAAEGQAHIIVTDTGKGISPDFLPHIFDSFRQQDISITRQHGGLGLGLAIVRYLVEAHGGTIRAASPGEGQGATFTVSLPLLSPDQPDAAVTDIAAADLDLTGVRVLAIDDNPDARELLTTLLTQYGAIVKVVSSAVQGLVQLESFHPDVLISDIGMPDIDGYTLIRRVRDRPAEQGGQVPAIALTAYTREEDQQRTLASGYQNHLSKPIEIEALVQAVSRLTRSPQNP